jgi:hypothetical protein
MQKTDEDRIRAWIQVVIESAECDDLNETHRIRSEAQPDEPLRKRVRRGTRCNKLPYDDTFFHPYNALPESPPAINMSDTSGASRKRTVDSIGRNKIGIDLGKPAHKHFIQPLILFCVD